MRSLTHPFLVDPPLLHQGVESRVGLGYQAPQLNSQTLPLHVGLKFAIPRAKNLKVAHHGFSSSEEVYHPRMNGGDLIGEVVDTRPELDIALVRLTPAASSSFTNQCYFQAKSPTCLLKSSQISQGAWSEVDGMSSGLFSMMNCGIMLIRPMRPIGHPELDFENWDTRSVGFLFGNVNSAISDAVCGAPIVDVESGGVSGFFHRSDGIFGYSSVLDDLVAEGWRLT
ncbi:uncharacterized protein N7511_006921 [Penicillium nucicola]|uniref:uncharacterized protein n=1 Tax=Penicillium nucicola TaxID=1850975 RepID=UPI0025456A40|nr:uncharacterized protein N7511_006921 [Penicillium nucicola]KAJ5758227.1 hypothetical protein N7511_006921 [Penicillium nucicola]